MPVAASSHHQQIFSRESADNTARLPLFFLSIFMSFIYLRPADLVPASGPFRPVLVVVALTVITLIMSGNARDLSLMPNATAKCLIAFFLVTLFSTPFSYWVGFSFWESLEFFKRLAVFVLIVNIAASLYGQSRLVRIIILGNLFLAGFAINDYLRGNLYEGRIEGFVGGLFDDPNDLALGLVTAVPFVYWRFRVAEEGRTRLLLLGGLLMLVGGVVATQSRGGFLGLLVVASILFRQAKNKVAMFAIALVVAATVFVFSPEGSFSRFESITNYQQEENAQIRLEMWSAGLRMFLDHPVTGVGIGVFDIAYGQNYRNPNFPYNGWWTAHNSLVQVAAELGLPGLLLWIGLIVTALSTLRTTRQRLEKWAENRMTFCLLELNLAIRGSLIGFLVSSLFLSRAYDWIFVILLALATAYSRMIEKSEEAIGGRSVLGTDRIGARMHRA